MNIDPKVEELSNLITDNIENVSDTGVVEFNKDTFEHTLKGTDLTLDTIKAVHEHRDNVIAATGLAIGRKGREMFQGENPPDTVTGKFKAHKDEINGTFHRVRNTPDGKGNIIPKPNVLMMGYSANGKEGTKGQLKAVKTALSKDIKNL